MWTAAMTLNCFLESELDEKETQSPAPSHFLKEDILKGNLSFFLFPQHHHSLETLQNNMSKPTLQFRLSV